MTDPIVSLIFDYQKAIEKVLTAFKNKFNRSDLLTACRSDKIIPKSGAIVEYGIKHYNFHGIGINATFEDNSSVDFDFAFLPDQRNDGFDLWRLSEFVVSQPTKYPSYANNENLEVEFNKLILDKIIIKPDSTSLYFFKEALFE